jgi:hypothetical protein
MLIYKAINMNLLDSYSIEDFLENAKGKSWGTLVKESHQEFRNLQKLRITPTHPLFRSKSSIEYYKDFLGEFCFLISQLHKPAGMPDDQFRRTRQVLESLVERNELPPKVLEIYG